MSNLAKRNPILDPEFQAVYEAEVLPGKSDRRPNQGNSESPKEGSTQNGSGSMGADSRDPLLELKAIAEKNQAEYIPRTDLKDGSFDQIEHDLSNAGRVFWNFVTRD